MKTLTELARQCRSLLNLPMADIESPRHLHLLGLVPVVDMAKLEEKLVERHPELSTEGVSIADIIESNYRTEAVEWLKRYALECCNWRNDAECQKVKEKEQE